MFFLWGFLQVHVKLMKNSYRVLKVVGSMQFCHLQR